MLNFSLNQNGLVFTVNIDGKNLNFKDWSTTDDCIYYFPLATLVDNGQAYCYEDECVVPFENLYLLDKDDQKLLGVPKR